MQTSRAAWNDLLGRIAVPELAVPTAAAHSGPTLALLPHISAVAVTGKDAAKFLQKQLTNDLDEVTENRGQATGYCTPKGRLISIAHVTQWPDGYLLRVPHSNAPRLVENLLKYRLRTQVEIAELDVVAVGISGRDTPWSLTDDHDVYGLDGAVAHRIPSDRIEVVGTAEAISRVWPEFVADARLTGPEGWISRDVQAGMPTIVPATEEAFVPQMVNLDLVGGVSFTKGCYPGQEIVARLHYLGKSKRRMYRAWIDGTERPLPGAAIERAEGSSGATGTALGKVVSSVPIPGGGIDLLVSIQIAAHDEPLTVLDQPLEWRPLPYPVEDAETPTP